MNVISLLCTAIASGCAGGLVVAYRDWRVSKDALTPAPEPVDELDGATQRETFDAEHAADLTEWNEEFAKLRAAREKARAVRASRLRMRYLAAGAGRHRQDATEVPA